MVMWEPWTGCYAASVGCKYCYFYGLHSKRCGQNTIVKTDDFNKPLEMKTKTKQKIESGKTVAMCFATDFFLPETDEWRKEIWQIIKQRSDLSFMFLTKRIDRFNVSLPDDWGDGYDNVTVGCTCENQETVDYRMPLFLSYPIKHRIVACSPLLSAIDLSPYLHGIEHITCGGETSREARVCDFNWIISLRKQCQKAGITFWFKNTGSKFLKDGVVQTVNPYMQNKLAKEMNLNIGRWDASEV